MSHLIAVTTKSQFTDKECLIKALEKTGFKNIKSDRKQTMFDYYGKKTKLQADVIIPRNQNALYADVGFTWDEKSQQYQITADSMEYRFTNKVSEITTNYNKALVEKKVSEMEAINGPAVINWITKEDGTEQLQVQFAKHIKQYAKATNNYGGL